MLVYKYGDGQNVRYTYTKTNQIKTMTDWNGTASYEYDANGQMLRATSADGQMLRYTWTKLGQKKSMGYPTGDTVRYEYGCDKIGLNQKTLI